MEIHLFFITNRLISAYVRQIQHMYCSDKEVSKKSDFKQEQVLAEDGGEMGRSIASPVSSTEVSSSLQSVWAGGRGWTPSHISTDIHQPPPKVGTINKISLI